MEERKNRNDGRGPDVPAGYDPPEVEEVLSAEELNREIHYAGTPISGGGGGAG
jgi:hypothetical protein